MDEPTTGYASVTTDDMTVESNTESAESMRVNFGLPVPEAVAVPAESLTPEVADGSTPAAEETAEKPPAERNTDGTFKAKSDKPRDNPIARMKDATAKEAAAKRERDETAAENARLKAELETLRAPKPVAQPEPVAATPQAEWKQFAAMPGAPKLTDFDSVEEHTAAMAWFIGTKLQERREQQQASEAAGRTWQDRLKVARAKMPDFDQRLKRDLPMNEPTKFAIMESPVGPELLIYLSDHEDLAQRLSTLHPIHVMRELGKLEARLEAAAEKDKTGSAPETPPASQAKPPIQPVGASPSVSDADDGSDDEPVEKFIARENAKERKAARR